MNRKIIASLLVLFFIQLITVGQVPKNDGWKSCSAAEVADALDAMNRWFVSNKTYAIKIKHHVYAGYDSNKIIDQDEGYVVKNNNFYHSYLLGVHTIQDKNAKLTIDTAERIILVANPDEMHYDLLEKEITNKILKMCKNFKVLLNKQDKTFRFVFSSGMYEYMEIGINNKHQLTRLCYFFRDKFPLAGNENDKDNIEITVKPRLEMVYDNYTLTVNPQSMEFDESSFVTFKNNKYFPSGKYKNYTIKDLRIKPLP